MHGRSSRLGALCGAAAAAAVLLALAGCSGISVPHEKEDYVGHWEGEGMTLTIGRDGGVSYERKSGSGKTSVNAPLKSFEGDDFVVGVLFLTTKFEVTEPPHEADGAWKMTVDGVELTRVP
jgi:hypothetical protein